MPLRNLCGEAERFAEVGFLKIRKVFEKVVERAPCSESLNNHSDSHTHTANAGLAAHHFRVHRKGCAT